ncbi:hypothetical protein OF83DRAFT_1154066 [Amylostereum chailletii]|nr:hypothetical protein OF83DRAFT_1154066 [Amylostereum chailletii]
MGVVRRHVLKLNSSFKKSGEFDRLRRELLNQFRHSDSKDTLMDRVEDIARQRLEADSKISQKGPDVLHRELLQELDRYPILERALADVPVFTDPNFTGSIRKHARTILQKERKEARDHATKTRS